MKRKAFIQHLTKHGCELLREGGRHSVWWKPADGRKSAVPRHSEVRDILVKKICNDLDVPKP